jgi:hypothetical protein
MVYGIKLMGWRSSRRRRVWRGRAEKMASLRMRRACIRNIIIQEADYLDYIIKRRK